jgi:cholesterol transport system auxiliary component
MSAHRLHLRLAIVAAATAFALTACGGILPKKEPMEILQPQVQVAPDAAWPQANWQLSIPRPSANEMLDSRRMVVSPTPGRIEVYKGVAWYDQVPDIIQSATVAAFEDSGRIAAVGRQAKPSTARRPARPRSPSS